MCALYLKWYLCFKSFQTFFQLTLMKLKLRKHKPFSAFVQKTYSLQAQFKQIGIWQFFMFNGSSSKNSRIYWHSANIWKLLAQTSGKESRIFQPWIYQTGFQIISKCLSRIIKFRKGTLITINKLEKFRIPRLLSSKNLYLHYILHCGDSWKIFNCISIVTFGWA